QVNRIGSALRHELGVRPGGRVLLLMLDCPEMVFSFFGAIKIGAVPVPVNTLWTSTDYEYVASDSRAGVIIVSAPLRPKLAGIVRGCPSVRHIVVVGEDGNGDAGGFDALTRRASPALIAEPASRAAPAFRLHS